MRTGSSVLHFGPAHPAAHGVLRCLLVMRAEWIASSVLTLGLLHRGTEKLMECRHLTTNTWCHGIDGVPRPPLGGWSALCISSW